MAGPGMGPTGARDGGAPPKGPGGVAGTADSTAPTDADGGGAAAGSREDSEAELEQPPSASPTTAAHAMHDNFSIARHSVGSESKYVQRVSRRGVFLHDGHCSDDAEGRGRIVGRDLGKCRSAHPAADAGIHRDILLAVRTHEGHRIADDSGT